MANAYEIWKKSDFYICPVCKERFHIPPYVTEWGYKVGTKSRPKPVCSYSCLNKAKKKKLKGEHFLDNTGEWQKNYRERRLAE
jgi:hypothetical protein